VSRAAREARQRVDKLRIIQWYRGETGRIEVDIKGTPGSRLTHEIYAEDHLIGTWSTGTKAINAIPFVCAAKPGLLSPLDLPLGRMLKLRA
jgi:hypothetical protein